MKHGGANGNIVSDYELGRFLDTYVVKAPNSNFIKKSVLIF